MKHASKAIVVLIMLSITALAGRYLSPEAAAMDAPQVRQILNHGYSVNAVETEAVMYKTQPSGVYHWGRVTLTAHGNDPATTYASYKVIEVDIRANDNGQGISFQVTNVSVTDIPYF